MYQEALEHRKGLIKAFSLGFRKFVTPSYLSLFMDAHEGLQAHAKQAAPSRRHQVPDGVDYFVPVSTPPVNKSAWPFLLGRSTPGTG
jgi:hypothetical protein